MHASKRCARASVTWDNRPGPARQVVDVVCLVPDVPTFLDALATWDSSHWFPILLDDAEYSLKFLRAFRPSRIVRFPKKVEPAAGEDLWKRAVAAIGRSWTTDDSAAPAGDARPPIWGRCRRASLSRMPTLPRSRRASHLPRDAFNRSSNGKPPSTSVTCSPPTMPRIWRSDSKTTSRSHPEVRHPGRRLRFRNPRRGLPLRLSEQG